MLWIPYGICRLNKPRAASSSGEEEEMQSTKSTSIDPIKLIVDAETHK